MNCLFCKEISDNSKSIEHIIPESLGNKDIVLPKGIVCDNCNQYFATKIEKILLEQSYFKNVRHRAQIENKKGRIPVEKATIISPAFGEAEIIFEKDKTIVNILDKSVAEKVAKSSRGSMVIQTIDKPEDNNKALSKLLAKMAVEGLLHFLINEEGWIDEVMTNTGLDEIKKYARYGHGVNFWPYHQRRIYSENTRFNHPDISIKNYEVLHEFMILPTKEEHYYFVIAIMGIEYTMSLGGPGIDSYKVWLDENDNKSILIDPKAKQSISE